MIPFISGASPHDPDPFDLENPMSDVLPFLRDALGRAAEAGVGEVLLDPGTGYRYPGVSAADKERYQLKVYARLPELAALGHPCS